MKTFLMNELKEMTNKDNGNVVGDEGRRAVGDQGLLRGPRVGCGNVPDSCRFSIACLHWRLQHDAGPTFGMFF